LRFTVRLENDNYLDLEFDLKSGTLYIHSPIPEITKGEIHKLATVLGYKIHLIITNEVILPRTYKRKSMSNYSRLLIVCKMLEMIITDK
jgi:hypothetical protein